jgi:putative membrane protein
MMIIWFLFLAAVILGIVWFGRSMMQRGEMPPSVGQRRSSLDVLEERYARGEINRDEYLQKRRDILGE